MRTAVFLVLIAISQTALSDEQLDVCVDIELEIRELQETKDRRFKGRINHLKKLASDWQCYRRHTEIMKIVGFR